MTQRGAILAFETKNNKNKVAKWTAGALLAGADMIKLGYCSRAGPRDNTNHIILGTQVWGLCRFHFMVQACGSCLAARGLGNVEDNVRAVVLHRCASPRSSRPR